MNKLSFLSALATMALSALASGQDQESKKEALSPASPIGHCLSISMSSPLKGISLAQAVLSSRDSPLETQIRAFDCMAHAEVILGKSDAAREDEGRALHLLNSSHLSEPFRANILSNAGGVFTALGDSSRAIELFEAASTLAKQQNLPMIQVAVLMNLASLYSETLDEPATADRYFSQAIQLAKPLHRDDVYMYFNYGFNLAQLKKYAEADSIFMQVIDLSQGNPNLEGVRYRAKSQQAIILLAEGRVTQALALLHDAIPELRRLSDIEGEARALLSLADIQSSRGYKREALRSAQRALRLSEQSKFTRGRIEAMHLLVRIYLAMNLPRKALGFSERLHALEIADLKQHNYRGIVSLEAELHNQASEYENKQLQAQLEIRTLEIKRGNLIRNGLIGALSATLALGCAFYFYHRHIRRTLQALSTTDSLTGLLNRRGIKRHLAEYQDGDAPQTDKQMALLLIDTDDFKRINDKYRHSAGDLVLSQLAKLLQDACRAEDLLARWGGEEFLIRTWPTDVQDATAMVERLRSLVEKRAFTISDGVELSVTISIGFVLYPLFPGGADRGWRDALHLADLALYAAKDAGRNAWVGIWGVTLDSEITAKAIASNIRKAEEAGQIKITSSRPLVWEDP
ncbi:diguanylate cyclase [Terriglobus tenax]|uniref:diguanylate cyclase n=1 Tax=Terriglobus tenax TaxID=1111115 RepID=UPI00295A571D|nr:diguanylate cyclase [Terriglobus tenax]